MLHLSSIVRQNQPEPQCTPELLQHEKILDHSMTILCLFLLLYTHITPQQSYFSQEQKYVWNLLGIMTL